MALPTIINFVVSAGDNATLEFSVETGPFNANGAEVSFAVYEQSDAVPTSDTPIIEKLMSYGIEVDHAEGVTTFYVEFEQADTLALLGNYYYEAKIVDGDGKNITAAAGLVTVTGFSTDLSVRSIKIRFPEFADVNDYIIDYALAMATSIVGDNDGWLEDDIVSARMYLTAHLISTAPEVTGTGQTEAGIASESIGRLSVSYTTMTSAQRAEMLSTSKYGERYLQMLRGNFGGPVVI